jgi:signal transduction histidine kinase
MTELAIDEQVLITNEEFHVLNRSLDNAIAAAVTEYGRQREHVLALGEAERLGRLAHELRNLLSTSILSFQMINSGRVAVGGSTAMVLGRSLLSLRDLIDTTLSEVRLSAGTSKPTRISIAKLLGEVEHTAALQANYRKIGFVLELPAG